MAAAGKCHHNQRIRFDIAKKIYVIIAARSVANNITSSAVDILPPQYEKPVLENDAAEFVVNSQWHILKQCQATKCRALHSALWNAPTTTNAEY